MTWSFISTRRMNRRSSDETSIKNLPGQWINSGRYFKEKKGEGFMELGFVILIRLCLLALAGYTLILICRYLKCKMEGKLPYQTIVIKEEKTFFVTAENGLFSINLSQASNLYVEQNRVFAELTNGDTYCLKSFERQEEAVAYLNRLSEMKR